MRIEKFLWLSLFVIISLATWSYLFDKRHVHEAPSIKLVTKTSVPEINEPTKPIHPQLRPRIDALNFSAQRIPSYSAEIKKTPHQGLPDGFKIVQDVFAVKVTRSKDFKEKKIAEARGFVFLQVDGNSVDGANVVIDERNDKLYPLSSIIKLKNVNEDLRVRLITAGHIEHFFREDLEIMYLQSTHGEVINLFNELERQGLKPEFEILRGYHRAK